MQAKARMRVSYSLHTITYALCVCVYSETKGTPRSLGLSVTL